MDFGRVSQKEFFEIQIRCFPKGFVKLYNSWCKVKQLNHFTEKYGLKTLCERESDMPRNGPFCTLRKIAAES